MFYYAKAIERVGDGASICEAMTLRWLVVSEAEVMDEGIYQEAMNSVLNRQTGTSE